MEKEKKKIKTIDFDTVLQKRKKEKELKYLITAKKKQFQKNVYTTVLAKAHLTLQNNWRIAAGEIKHEGLFLNYHYKWFNGFWSWDFWKYAVGLSYYNIDLAKNQMRAMFDFQEEDGFIVDCIFRDTSIEPHNYRDTKTPLSAWAVAKIFEKDKDLGFIREFYPKLKKYHYWWYAKRDHDKDGLCEYGSTDGSLEAAKWESSMDNAIRFDNSKILKNQKEAYSLDQESVDLNAYLYAEKMYLVTLSKALNEKNDAAQYLKEAETLKIKMQEQFYTKILFQTMSADHPRFDPLKGYWRSPNWLGQSCFGVKRLRNYGFGKEADQATLQILTGAEGILEKGKAIRENYHPITGQRLHAQNFSWSAAHIIMLLTKE